MGGFLVVAAGAEEQSSALRALFAGQHVGDLMTRPAFSLRGALSVADAITEYVLPALYTAYPVEDPDGCAVGIVRLHDLRAVAPADRTWRSVIAITDRDPELLVPPTTPVSELLSLAAFARVGRAVVVAPDRTIVGIISVSDLERWRTLRSLRPAPARVSTERYAAQS